jgi:hypothetical protein
LIKLNKLIKLDWVSVFLLFLSLLDIVTFSK